MTIKSSGTSLAISEIVTEFGDDAGGSDSLSEYYAGGDNVGSGTGDIPSSGAINMSVFYGTSNRVTITLTIGSNTTNYNIFDNRGGTYAAGTTDVVVVNNAVVSSTSVGTAAMDTGSGWTSGDTVTIDNNSTIVGDGGNGGAGGTGNGPGAGAAGGAAGHAINMQIDTTIDNTGGTISGGGGGGGGGGGSTQARGVKGGTLTDTQSGGGGGGGFGGGAAGAAGATGSGSGNNNTGSAGSAGSVSAAGSAGAGTGASGAGGGGGGAGAAGAAGAAASSGNQGAGGAAGAAGKAVNLNSNSVTFTATGTRNGATS